MVRIQLDLTPGEYAAVRREARRPGLSASELMRHSLLRVLPVHGSKPWMQYAGMITMGDSCSSQRIDEVIY
jgi:hypothetical protein